MSQVDIVPFHGEAAALDILDLADGDKALRIRLLDDADGLSILVGAHDTLHLFDRGFGVATLSIEHGDTEIICYQMIADLLVVLGYHSYLHTILPEDQNMAKGIGHDIGIDETIDDIGDGREGQLAQHDDGIQCVHGLVDRKMQRFGNQQSRDIHPAGGSAGSHDDADTGTAYHTTADGSQDDIVRDAGDGREMFEDGQSAWIEEGGQDGTQHHVSFPKDETDRKNDQVDGHGKNRQIDAGQSMQDQGDTGGTAHDQTEGLDKGIDAQGQKGGTDKVQQYIFCIFYVRILFHDATSV